MEENVEGPQMFCICCRWSVLAFYDLHIYDYAYLMDNYNVWRVYGIDAARLSLSVSGERHFVRRSI